MNWRKSYRHPTVIKANFPNDFGKFFRTVGLAMGGFGSGRKWGTGCTDDMRQIDIRLLARGGYLKAGIACGWHWMQRGEVAASIKLVVDIDRVFFTYRQREHGGAWQDMCYPVGLVRTACHLGGERLWWRCPAAGCGRRVAVLYGGGVFACRHCHRLAYRCQRETYDDRATRRANTLRAKMRWEPGIFKGEGCKPKGMHWRTFERLKAEYDAYAHAVWMRMAERLGMMNSRLVGLGLGPLNDLCR